MKKGAQGATQTSNKSRLQLVFIFTRVHTKFGFNLKKGTHKNQPRKRLSSEMSCICNCGGDGGGCKALY